MRTRTKEQRSGFWLELIEPEALQFISTFPDALILHRDLVERLTQYATAPQSYLTGKGELYDGERNNFARLFADMPDFVPAFIAFVRKTVYSPAKRRKIMRWLLTETTGNDSYGKTKLQMELGGKAIAAAIGRDVSDTDVRIADSQLRKRLTAKRAEYFLTNQARQGLTPKQIKKFSRLLPPAIVSRTRRK